MTLGVLAPYRRLGIARTLLSNLVSVAEPGKFLTLPDQEKIKASKDVTAPKSNKDKSSKSAAASATPAEPKRMAKPADQPTKEYRVDSIYLHVQTNNEEARKLYTSMGFQEEKIVEEYYRQGVEPRSAVLLVKKAA